MTAASTVKHYPEAMSVGDEFAGEYRETEAAHAAVRRADDFDVVAFGVRTPTNHRVVAVANDLHSLMQPAPELGEDLAAIVERATLIGQDLWIWGPTYKSWVTVDDATHDVKIEPFPAPAAPGVLHYRIDLDPGDLDAELAIRPAVNRHWWTKMLSPGAREELLQAAREPRLNEAAARLLNETGYPIVGMGIATQPPDGDWPLGLREFILGLS